MKYHAVLVACLAAGVLNATGKGAPQLVPRGPEVPFVFTSDAHYGITRTAFRGGAGVAARAVNRALVQRINALAGTTLPNDGGLGAGSPVGAADFIVEGGDTTNRAEVTADGAIQSAATSWSEFVEDYFGGLALPDRSGSPAPLFVVPGNHETSSAIGFHRAMSPATDAAPMAGIFNRMLKPPAPRSASTFSYLDFSWRRLK